MKLNKIARSLGLVLGLYSVVHVQSYAQEPLQQSESARLAMAD